MAVLVLPTRTDAPFYSFEVELDKVSFLFEFHWNERDQGWYFSIADNVSGDLLLAGRRVVVDFPLLARFRDPRLPAGDIYAIDTAGGQRGPGLADLGERVKMLYYPFADLPAAFKG